MAEISDMQLAAAVLDIVPQLDAEVVTIRVVTEKLAAHFDVTYKAMRAHRAAIKQLVTNEFCAGDDDDEREKENVAAKRARKTNRISDDDEEEDEDEEDEDEENEGDEEESEQDDEDQEQEQSPDDEERGASKKRRRSSPKAAPAKRKAPPVKKVRQNPDSPGMAALKDMARAARLLSPRVYAALKKLESEGEQEELIRELLSKNGVRFSGRYPQKREVDSVRKKKDLERDMEGIDTSLIIEDTNDRPRRASRSAGMSYADQLYVQPDSDDEEQAQVQPRKNGGDSDSGEDAVRRKRKPAARHKRGEGDEDEEEEAEGDVFEANDSESSEAEF